MSLEDHMEVYLAQGIDRKEAMKKVAKDRGISKRDVYQGLMERGRIKVKREGIFTAEGTRQRKGARK